MRAALVLSISLLLVSGALAERAWAFGGAAPAAAEDANFTAGKAAVDAGEWDKAIELMKASIASNPNNADAYNYLGYAYRKNGDFDNAFAAYAKALAIDPKHRGANEYLGEAYLETGQIEKARAQLERLDDLCPFGCPEYTELKKRLEAKEG